MFTEILVGDVSLRAANVDGQKHRLRHDILSRRANLGLRATLR